MKKLKSNIRNFVEKNFYAKLIYEELSHYKSLFKRHLDDKEFVIHRYFQEFNEVLDLDNPKTYTEKINYIKINDFSSTKRSLTDKVKVREYLKSIGYSHLLTPLIGVYDDIDCINFEKLCDTYQSYYLKTNHNSGTVFRIENNISKFKLFVIKSRVKKVMKRDYSLYSREQNYKGIQPQIILEENIMNENPLIEYKFFKVGDNLEFCSIYKDVLNNKGVKSHEPQKITVDLEYKPVKFSFGKPINVIDNHLFNKPDYWNELVRTASEISRGIRDVRIDLIWNGNNIFFGEFTFYNGGGFFKVIPKSADLELGKKILIK